MIGLGLRSAHGRAHVIWNDGEGVRCAASKDDGANWTLGSRIHGQGGASHLAVGPLGELAVRITPSSLSGSKFTEGVDLIAVSLNGGKTWQKYAAHGEPPVGSSRSRGIQVATSTTFGEDQKGCGWVCRPIKAELGPLGT